MGLTAQNSTLSAVATRLADDRDVSVGSAFPFPGWSLRALAAAAVWIGALAASLTLLDVPVADWVHRAVPVASLMWLFMLMKVPGHFGFTLIVAAALLVGHRARWRAAAFLCLSGIMSGLLYTLAKWFVGRTRPFQGTPPFEWHPFAHGFSGLFVAEYHSFPSGHTCLAFATAAAMSVLLPKWKSFFFLCATVTATERILQNSHYMSDVIAGAGFGILSMMLTWWLCDLVANAATHRAVKQVPVTKPCGRSSSGPFSDT
jgi:membrane-associated phospholipid phosphatase